MMPMSLVLVVGIIVGLWAFWLGLVVGIILSRRTLDPLSERNPDGR